jgi:hypothetical protein
MAIRLMREKDVPTTSRDLVFRASRLYAILFVLACLGACAAMIALHRPRPPLNYYISGVILLALLWMRRLVTARFQPLNWLVRTADDGLFIHFRSYLNDRLSTEDSTVVFLPYSDIRSARLMRERLATLDYEGAKTVQTRRLVEFELATDPAPLAEALATESARPGAKEKRWYGSSATLYKDYPVLMQSPPFLRVEWRAVPSAGAFLDGLRQHVQVAPPVTISEDFANLQGLTREQQEQRLRDLNQRGHTIDAVYMARRLYGLDLTQATKFVKELSAGMRS